MHVISRNSKKRDSGLNTSCLMMKRNISGVAGAGGTGVGGFGKDLYDGRLSNSSLNKSTLIKGSK